MTTKTIHTDGETKLLYVICAYYDDDPYKIKLNVEAAKHVVYSFLGYDIYAIATPINTAFMGKANDSIFFYKATLEVMRRCDAVYVMQGAEKSHGAKKEIEEALRLGMPIFTTIKGAVECFKSGLPNHTK